MDEPKYLGAMQQDKHEDLWVRNNRGWWVLVTDGIGLKFKWPVLNERYGPLTPFVPDPDEVTP